MSRRIESLAGALADCRGSIVNPSPASNNGSRYVLKGVRNLRVAVFDAGKHEGVFFANQAVKAELVVDGEVTVSQMVVVKTWWPLMLMP